MAGNVREYTNDFVEAGYWASLFAATPKPIDPPGPARGETVVSKGGSYFDTRETMSVYYRIPEIWRQSGGNFYGFRTILEIPKPK